MNPNRTAPAILPPAMPRAALDYAESFATPATRRAILKAEAEAAQVAALPQVLAFLDARPVAHGLKVAPRHYVCRVCGNVESFSTNYTGPHYSACGSCSWRGGRDNSGVWYSAQDKGRPHVYAGQNPRGLGEENPHARPQVKAEAQDLDARTVANVLEALKAQAEAAPPRLALPSPYVLEAFARLDAETGLALVYLPQNVATPWASYRVALATGVCVAGDYLAPYDNARALALRAFSKRLGDALGARAGVTA